MNNDLIKKYLADELSSQERNAFEQQMENDPFLKESVEGLLLQKEHWQIHQLEKLEHELMPLQNTESITIVKHSKNRSFRFFKFAAAASIIGVIVFVGWQHFFVAKNINTANVYADYFKPLTHPDATVRGENMEKEETKAIQAYESEDYFAAVNYYKKLVENHPANVKDNLFYGISLLATNQPEKAIDVLSNIQTSVEYHYDIQWYLALAYLKNKQIQETKKSLNELTKEDNFYQNQANEILNKLNGAIAMKD